MRRREWRSGERAGVRSDADAPASPSSPCDSTSLDTALYPVHVSVLDSVADLRIELQELLALPPRLKYRHRRDGAGHELVLRGELLGEHLLLRDYGVRDGDTLHFAVRTDLVAK